MRAKVSASHLARRAYVYVRQSTTTQVLQHGESTHRQYALALPSTALASHSATPRTAPASVLRPFVARRSGGTLGEGKDRTIARVQDCEGAIEALSWTQ